MVSWFRMSEEIEVPSAVIAINPMMMDMEMKEVQYLVYGLPS